MLQLDSVAPVEVQHWAAAAQATPERHSKALLSRSPTFPNVLNKQQRPNHPHLRPLSATTSEKREKRK